MDPRLPVFPKFDPSATITIPDPARGGYLKTVINARPNQTIHQTLHVGWLGEGFEDDLAEFFAKRHPDLNALEVCTTTLILQSAYVNDLFQSEVEKIAAPFGNFRSAAIKGIPRALEKVTNPLDYFGRNGMPPGRRWDATAVDGIKPGLAALTPPMSKKNPILACVCRLARIQIHGAERGVRGHHGGCEKSQRCQPRRV